MFKALRYKKIIRRTWKDIAIVLAAFIAITLWQQRNLLATSEAAQNFILPQLQTNSLKEIFRPGERTLVYFFAPWCSICKLSIHNLSFASKEVNVVAVALDFGLADEVSEFIGDQQITVPVLLGNNAVSQAYRISTYPTYYMIDREGKISEKSSGYSSAVGIRWRSD